MHIYAQINSEDICIGIQQSPSEIRSENLVQIEGYDVDLIWRKYDRTTATWSEEKYEPEPPFPEIDETTQLKLALAELAESYEQTVTDLQLALAEVADLVAGGEG